LKPYWGKPAVRNFRGGDGNVGIIRSPVRAIALPDNRHEAEDESSSRERTSDPLGPESCGVAREGDVEALTGDRRGGYPAPKRCNPDADVLVMRGRQYERER
jgi:hypothetical protein